MRKEFDFSFPSNAFELAIVSSFFEMFWLQEAQVMLEEFLDLPCQCYYPAARMVEVVVELAKAGSQHKERKLAFPEAFRKVLLGGKAGFFWGAPVEPFEAEDNLKSGHDGLRVFNLARLEQVEARHDKAFDVNRAVQLWLVESDGLAQNVDDDPLLLRLAPR
jgi:hypothetical protein